MVSRHHATLSLGQGAPNLRDEGSANGTRVNGNRAQTAILHPGDQIIVGNSLLTVEFQPDPSGREVSIAPTTAQAPVFAQQTQPEPSYSAPSAHAYPPRSGPPNAQQQAPYYAPQPPAPFMPPPQPYPYPEAQAPTRKRGRVGRLLPLGCLLPILACGLLSGGVYVAFRSGALTPQMILKLVSRPLAQIAPHNLRDTTTVVTILQLEPDKDNPPLRHFEVLLLAVEMDATLKQLHDLSERVDRFEAAAVSASPAACYVTLDQLKDDGDFVAVVTTGSAGGLSIACSQ